MKGTVKWWGSEKRYGFILPDDGGDDVFVHANGLTDGVEELEQGQAVEYEIKQGKKGPEAVQVRPIG